VQHLDPGSIAEELPQRREIGQRQRIEHRARAGVRGLDQAQLGKVRALAHELGIERDEIAGRKALESLEQFSGGGDRRRG
jgi:hypothetical protein